jgi:aminoglycoside phosphotransferase (APT) family kinase protein
MYHQLTPDPRLFLDALNIGDKATATALPGGADTLMWRVHLGEEQYALRVFQPAQEQRFQREKKILAAANWAKLPVPRIVETVTAEGYLVMLLSWCPGQPLLEVLRNNPAQVWNAGLAFGQAQARLHLAPLSKALPHRSDDWIAWMGSGNDQLAQALEQTSRGVRHALLHLDYHPYNVIMKDGQISGIIDWANAQVGDPRADFARTYSILRVDPWLDDPPVTLTFLRWILERAWRRGYQQVAGTVADTELFYAWAGQAMVRDLGQRVEQPESWLQPRHLRMIQAWSDERKAKAGLPPINRGLANDN